MTLSVTPARLVLVVLAYMLVLILVCTLVAWMVVREPQPPEGRPLRTRPPVLEPRT